MPRFPFILWKALVVELGRLLVLTTGALVLLISFAASVKPLADGKIGLPDMLTLMVVLAVPMLQFALPFAAGFAATFAYHRFVSDREAMAAMATGISHKSLLVPAFAWATVLAVVVALLTNTVIPGFLRTAERVITRDIARVVTTPLEQGQTLTISDWDVHAERVTDLEPAEGSAALDHLVLEGVMLTQRLDNAEDVEGSGFVSAARVDMWLYDAIRIGMNEPGTAVGLVVSSPSGVLPSANGASQITTDSLPIGPLLIPTRFDDDPKYLTFEEMRAVRRDPTLMNRVADDTKRLASALGAARVADQVTAQLEDEGAVTFERRRGEDVVETITLYADGARVEGDELVLVGSEASASRRDPLLAGSADRVSRPFRVVYERGQGLRALTHRAVEVRLSMIDGAALAAQNASGALLGRNTSPSGGDVLVNASLFDVSTTQPDLDGAPAETSTLDYNAMSHAMFSGLEELGSPPRALIAEADRIDELGLRSVLDANAIERASERLENRLDDLEREILSKAHERIAFTIAAFLMVVTGGVMAMKLKDELPLHVYIWAFLPALVSVITISSGQSMTHDTGGSGLLLMYAGVIGLGLFTVREYRIVSRR